MLLSNSIRNKRHIFVTSQTYSGGYANYGGMDGPCLSDANKLNSKTYKALVAEYWGYSPLQKVGIENTSNQRNTMPIMYDETYISSLGSKTFEYFVPTYGANYQKCYNYAHLVCVQTENNN